MSLYRADYQKLPIKQPLKLLVVHETVKISERENISLYNSVKVERGDWNEPGFVYDETERNGGN